MKPESIFDCCSHFLSEKYWLQVHASILKLKIVVSQSLQKGEECAVLFFFFAKTAFSRNTSLEVFTAPKKRHYLSVADTFLHEVKKRLTGWPSKFWTKNNLDSALNFAIHSAVIILLFDLYLFCKQTSRVKQIDWRRITLWYILYSPLFLSSF